MAHCVYNTYFVLLWGSAVAAIPTALGLAVWLLASAIPHEHRHAGRIVTLTLVVMVLIAWTVALRRHATRVLIRAGAFPAWFGCDFYPHDELEFRQAVVDARDRTGSLPALVGGGWGYFLKRNGPDGPRLFTHHFTGLVHGSTTRWRAGTTIAQVQRAFQKRNQSLPSHPTMDYISLGSWVACANHGNDGDLIKDDVIESVTVLDMMNDQQTTLAYRAARQLFDSADGPRFCVMDVTFKPVPNRMLQKRALKVETAQDAADWLARAPTSAFCSSAQRATTRLAFAGNRPTMPVRTPIRTFARGCAPSCRSTSLPPLVGGTNPCKSTMAKQRCTKRIGGHRPSSH